MVLLSALLVAAAAPAPTEDTACVLQRLTPQVRSGLIEEISNDRETGSIAAVEAAAAACGRVRGWSGELTGQLAARAVASVMLDESQARLQGAGISVALVDRWFDALPPNQQRMDGLLEASVDRLRDELVAAGVPEQVVDSHSAKIGFYVSARVFEAELLTPAR